MNHQPLANRIRPANLDEFIGQDHLVGENSPLSEAIHEGTRFSFILWGPPGSGKTTLARMYADALDANLYELSAVSAGKKDVKKVIDDALDNTEIPTILFLDEIHRFNKAQQDYLLPYVENGTLTLIGATTENPSFEIIGPLLSRTRVFTLEKLTEDELERIIDRANVDVEEEAKQWLLELANGDARQLLTMIENVLSLYGDTSITKKVIQNVVQERRISYDKGGDEHYNTISAFIKSMRAGQKSAAVYYLARMIEAGEDPKFIARRMVIFASEDIGLAQPTALVVANEVFRAVETVGLPEAGINLAHGAAYLATAEKDRSSYDAYKRALKDAKEYGNLEIPMMVRNAPTKLMQNLGYGEGYEQYNDKDFLPEEVQGKDYFK